MNRTYSRLTTLQELANLLRANPTPHTFDIHTTEMRGEIIAHARFVFTPDRRAPMYQVDVTDLWTSLALLRLQGYGSIELFLPVLTKMPGQTYEEYQAGVLSNQDTIAVKKEDLRTNSDLRRLKGVTEKDIARAAKYMLFYAMLDGKMAAVD